MRAASLTIWLKAGWMKSANWISQIGRMPASAAPMPIPTMLNSASGESITRFGPYLSYSPMVARNTPPRGPTSSPVMNTRSSRASSSSIASRIAPINVISAMLVCCSSAASCCRCQPGLCVFVHRCEHIAERLLQWRVRGLLCEALRLVNLLPGTRLDLVDLVVVQDAPLQQVRLKALDRVALLPLLHLLPRAVGPVVVVGG